MRKVFTLVMAAVAALTASAAPARKMVRFNDANPAIVSNLESAEFQAIKANIAETRAAMSRAGEEEGAIDLSGRYYTGVYDVIAGEGNQPIGMFVESIGYIDIVADPEVENGYLIKGFLQDWWNNGEEDAAKKITVNDLKATWDPAKKTLTIAPYQLLFEYTFQGESNPTPLHLTGADAVAQAFTKTAPIVLTYNYGLLTMDTSITAAFGLFEIYDNGDGSGSAYQWGAFNAYVPNGSIKCYMPDLQNDYEYIIHGVWLDGYAFINNFTGRDPLTTCHLKIDTKNNVLAYDGKGNSVGWILQYLNADGQNIDIDMVLYAAEMTENKEPTGTGYNVNGTIVKADNTEFTAELPTYGLFTEQDEYFTTIEDAVLTFKPAEVAGIKNVAAADVDNTNAPVRYYNLQGMSVNNPANGIFIRVQGTDVQKVLVK